MKKWIVLYFFSYTLTLFGEEDLFTIRELYYKSIESETYSKSFLNYFESKDVKSTAVLMGYNAVANFVQAKHYWNPIKKLEYFTKGQSQLEMAIHKDIENVELRFLRLSIQNNLPRFLNYYQNIEEDKSYLINQLDSIKDIDLKSRVADYLKDIKAIK